MNGRLDTSARIFQNKDDTEIAVGSYSFLIAHNICLAARLGASTGQKYSSTSTSTWKNNEYKYKYWIFKVQYFKKYLSTSTEYFGCKN